MAATDKTTWKGGEKIAAQAAKPPQGTGKMALSEGAKKALFALLAIAALGAIAYAVFSSAPQDAKSDGSEFYILLRDSPQVGLLYDVRGAEPQQASAIFQCGVDIISKGRFAGKNLSTVACDAQGCVLSSPGASGASKPQFDSVERQFYSSMPYILIKPGESGYAFYKRHMEIYIAPSAVGETNCDIAAAE